MASEIPVYERSVTATENPVQEFQPTTRALAESQNNLSAIGAKVAQTASNTLASQLGNELGKNPKGDLGMPLTDFDKNLEQSYKTQAHATLGLQAEKLITDSNLTVANAPRITPELIASSQANIDAGLKKIYEQAPAEIRPQLQATYGSAQLAQREQLSKRMLAEQHEDRRNNTILSNDRNAETAHALAASGNFQAANTLVETTEGINNSAVADNVGFTPQQGKVGTDTVRQSAINGRLQYEYEHAKNKEEYLKNLSKRPDWISDADYPSATNSLRSYVSNQMALKSNYEQLTMSQFEEKIKTDASSITGTELQSTLDKLSPLNASKLKIAYVSGIKAQQKDTADQNALNASWADPRAQANAPEKAKNDLFNKKVAYAMKADPSLSLTKAEAQVAASAGGEIPVFTKTLKNGLWSGDAAQMVEKARQINDLQANGNGHALGGLSDQDLAIASDIKHNFNPADPASAARIVTENKQNQDPEVRKNSEATFANNLYDKTRKNGVQTDDYILDKFGMQGGMFHSGFDSPWAKSFYASDILSNYRTNFINTGRDDARATDLTQDYIKNNYGKTSMNGSSEWTLHPIEKACGFSEGDLQAMHSINADIERQISEPLKQSKLYYDADLSDTYWTIENKNEVQKSSANPESLKGILDNAQALKNSRLQFTKHTRNGLGTTTETYPLRLVGNNFNWDLNVETADGPRSVFLEAPDLGVHTYTPDVQWINDHYQKKGSK